jgi:hypothetical protein
LGDYPADTDLVRFGCTKCTPAEVRTGQEAARADRRDFCRLPEAQCWERQHHGPMWGASAEPAGLTKKKKDRSCRAAVLVTGLHPDNRVGTRLAGGRRGGEPKSMSEQTDPMHGCAKMPPASRGTVNDYPGTEEPWLRSGSGSYCECAASPLGQWDDVSPWFGKEESACLKPLHRQLWD